ncbi:hypothetical protein VE04_06869 [Pseudogymnoascus sp. 24MN13]|nr:hypothetical protein VE04_06869 [Pseudogymnoascus sp. 24MN13]
MRAATDESRQLYFRSLLTDDILYYLFLAQFRSISFPFIFHRGIRRIAAEEALRRDLHIFTTFVARTLIYDTYRLCLQMDAREPTLVRDDSLISHEAVLLNYKAMVLFSPLGHMSGTLETLPANPELLLKYQGWKPKAHPGHTLPQYSPNTDFSDWLSFNY